jgi:hypothetical protein
MMNRPRLTWHRLDRCWRGCGRTASRCRWRSTRWWWRLLERHLPVPPGLRALDQRAARLRRLGAAGVVGCTWRPSRPLRGAAEHVALLRLRRGQAPDAGLRCWPARWRRRWCMGLGLAPGAARGAGAAPGGGADGLAWCASPTAWSTSMPLAHHRQRQGGAPRHRDGRARRRACCWPASTSRAGRCWACSTTTPPSAGTRIAGVPVLGRWRPCATRRARRGHPRHRRHAGRAPAQRRRALELAAAHRPAGADRAHGRRTARRPSRIERLRDIEPEDLLGREPVQLDEAGIGDTLRGKVVLITGAGGSIGSELCRQVARYARRGWCCTS